MGGGGILVFVMENIRIYWGLISWPANVTFVQNYIKVTKRRVASCQYLFIIICLQHPQNKFFDILKLVGRVLCACVHTKREKKY